jgi:hypothetical protein
MPEQDVPLEVVILRYLTANWSERVDRIDRIVMAAGLTNAIEDATQKRPACICYSHRDSRCPAHDEGEKR